MAAKKKQKVLKEYEVKVTRTSYATQYVTIEAENKENVLLLTNLLIKAMEEYDFDGGDFEYDADIEPEENEDEEEEP